MDPKENTFSERVTKDLTFVVPSTSRCSPASFRVNEMFEASVDGQPYDADKWGAYYKPAGLQVAGGAKSEDSAPAPVAQARPAVTATPAPADGCAC
mgnify:CR=1 FL=1